MTIPSTARWALPALICFAWPAGAGSQTCDPAELVRIGRAIIGPEKPRGFPGPELKATPTKEAPAAIVEQCRAPDTICAAEEEARIAAYRADLLRRLRVEVIALERCGYPNDRQ